jgi:tetratricopeptide (TPR) repeat protein
MKNRLRGLLCLLCLWSPLLPASREIPGDKQGLELLRQLSVAQPMLAEAFDLLAIRDLDGAGRLFDRCLEALAENPGACFGKACIADRRGDLAGALAWMERAEAASLFLDRLWASQKATLLKASQEEKDRLLELSLGLQVKGENSSVCRSHEYARESAKAAQKAKDISFQGDFDRSPFAVPAEYFSLHGNLLFKLKRYGEAEAKYLAALALEPGHPRCLNNLINVYFISGRIGPARDWLEKAGRLKVRVNSELARAVRRAAETPGPGRDQEKQ